MKKITPKKILVFVVAFVLTIAINVLFSKSQNSDTSKITSFVNEIKSSSDVNVFFDDYFTAQLSEVRQAYLAVAEKIKSANEIKVVSYTDYNEPGKNGVKGNPELVYVVLLDNEPVYVMTDKETGKVRSIMGLRKGDVIIGWV